MEIEGTDPNFTYSSYTTPPPATASKTPETTHTIISQPSSKIVSAPPSFASLPSRSVSTPTAIVTLPSSTITPVIPPASSSLSNYQSQAPLKPPSINKTSKPKKTRQMNSKQQKQPNGVPKSSKSSSSSSSTTHVTVIDGSISVNMCPHCSRVFCGKKALDVHTMKMHGKEYLSKKPQQNRTSPFTCWFCSAHFKTTELVVEHMTNAHENLDKLSKRVEAQEPPQVEMVTATTKPDNRKKVKKFVQIAPHKKAISKHPLSVVDQTALLQPTEDPPPVNGFKVSYALAYVPVYVTNRNEEEDTEKK